MMIVFKFFKIVYVRPEIAFLEPVSFAKVYMTNIASRKVERNIRSEGIQICIFHNKGNIYYLTIASRHSC